MIFFHKPFATVTKKHFNDICPKPKIYNLYNDFFIFLQTQEKIQKPNFKSFKLQRFTNRKKTLILKNNQINFVKTQNKRFFLIPLCDFSKLIFSTLFEKDIK